MKILQVAFLLLFNYLDSLPKLYSNFALAAWRQQLWDGNCVGTLETAALGRQLC